MVGALEQFCDQWAGGNYGDGAKKYVGLGPLWGRRLFGDVVTGSS